MGPESRWSFGHRFALRMDVEPRTEILPQDPPPVHPAKGIGLDDDLPRPEYVNHVLGSVRVAPANDDAGQRLGRVSIAEEDHIEAPAPQHPSGGARHTLPPGAVQHF